MSWWSRWLHRHAPLMEDPSVGRLDRMDGVGQPQSPAPAPRAGQGSEPADADRSGRGAAP